MNNRHYIALAVVICVVLSVVALFFVYKGAVAQSIVNVLNRNARAARACVQTSTLGTRNKRKFNTREYVNELHRIDASRCPKKFQLAWLDYVQAWEREGEQTPGVVLGELYLGMVGVATKSSSLEKMAVRPIEARDALERAWDALERVALEYDVRVVHAAKGEN